MKRSSGQALVLVLLSLAVVLTLVLYILSRSVTDILVSSKNEEASRAFSAAEAGIEQALVIGTGGSNSLVNNSAYVSSVTESAEGSSVFNYPVELGSGDSFTLWFVSHDSATEAIVCDASHPCFTGSKVRFCWGRPGTSGSSTTTPAVEVSVFYENPAGSLADIKIARATTDPNSSRISSNSFGTANATQCQIGGVTYAFEKTIDLTTLAIPAASYGTAGGLQLARVRMLYNTDQNHPIGASVNFAGNSTLPSQGQNIASTGTAGVSTRKINVFQGWPEPPSVFDYAIYNSTGLTK